MLMKYENQFGKEDMTKKFSHSVVYPVTRDRDYLSGGCMNAYTLCFAHSQTSVSVLFHLIMCFVLSRHCSSVASALLFLLISAKHTLYALFNNFLHHQIRAFCRNATFHERAKSIVASQLLTGTGFLGTESL